MNRIVLIFSRLIFFSLAEFERLTNDFYLIL